MSVFEFASGRGFDKSAHFNPAFVASFFFNMCNVQSISCAVSGLVGFLELHVSVT